MPSHHRMAASVHSVARCISARSRQTDSASQKIQPVNRGSSSRPTTDTMGEYALEVGETTVYGQDGALMDRGKIMVLWKKDEDGVWKMHRDTWNSSIPPSEA